MTNQDALEEAIYKILLEGETFEMHFTSSITMLKIKFANSCIGPDYWDAPHANALARAVSENLNDPDTLFKTIAASESFVRDVGPPQGWRNTKEFWKSALSKETGILEPYRLEDSPSPYIRGHALEGAEIVGLPFNKAILEDEYALKERGTMLWLGLMEGTVEVSEMQSLYMQAIENNKISADDLMAYCHEILNNHGVEFTERVFLAIYNRDAEKAPEGAQAVREFIIEGLFDELNHLRYSMPEIA